MTGLISCRTNAFKVRTNYQKCKTNEKDCKTLYTSFKTFSNNYRTNFINCIPKGNKSKTNLPKFMTNLV